MRQSTSLSAIIPILASFLISTPAILHAGYTGSGTIGGSATFYFPGPQSDEFYDYAVNVSPDISLSVGGSSSGPFGSGSGAASVSTFTTTGAVQINPSVAITVDSSVAGGLSAVSAGAGGDWMLVPQSPVEYLTGEWDLGVSGAVAPGDQVRVVLRARGAGFYYELDQYITDVGDFNVSLKGETADPVAYPYINNGSGPIVYTIIMEASMYIEIYTSQGIGNELLRSAQQRTAIYSASGSVGMTVVPEPAAIYMTAIGVMTCAGVYRLRRKQSSHHEE